MVMRLPNLKSQRERSALSQGELAEKAGMNRLSVSRIEAGRDVHPSTARKLAEALGVPPADLMEVDTMSSDMPADVIGRNVQALRKRQGLSEDELAERAGITRAAIRRI